MNNEELDQRFAVKAFFVVAGILTFLLFVPDYITVICLISLVSIVLLRRYVRNKWNI